MNTLEIIKNICEVIIENKNYLTELDQKIGDGDHGINLARGFEKIKEELPNFNGLKLNEIFNKIAMILMSNVGVASGALYSSACLKASAYLNKIDNKINTQEILNLFNEMINAIKSRGNSDLNEKTMLDTLIPAYNALKNEIDKKSSIDECLNEMENNAKIGMESTKNKIASKGRASYLKERSVGILDPGSVSSFLIIQSICKTLKGSK